MGKIRRALTWLSAIGGTIDNVVIGGTTPAAGTFTTLGSTNLPNKNVYVDGGRADIYTADGSMLKPYKTVLAALTVINADTGKNWILNVASGTYSDNLTITGPRYLSIRGQGVTLSGTILINSGVGTYDRIEFVGISGDRPEKGPALTISGKITATRSDDSLIYVNFSGCYVSGELETTTLGTWVLQYDKCRITGAITGTFTRAGHEQILIESYGFNEFVGAITGWVSFYNCHDSDFYSNITTTPYYESRFTNCSFGGSVSIIPVGGASSVVAYMDGYSYRSMLLRTPTLTGVTITRMDNHDTVVPDNDGATLTTGDLGKVYVCDSGSDQNFILPSVAATNVGAWVEFVKLGAGNLTITAVDSDTIDDSSAAGTVYCSDVGNASIKLRLCAATEWIPISATNTWITT